jgi:predicted ribosome quality control (RQC) complex YloA/Tae2 family protein
MKKSFNAATLAMVVEELQPLVGGQVQRIAQPSSLQTTLSIFRSGVGEKHLLIDVSPQFYRANLTTRRSPSLPTAPAFCMTLRKYLHGGRIISIVQRNGDRILDILVQHEGEVYLLSAELMGKHANLILVAADGKILHAAKLITSKQSRLREVLPGREYVEPPAPGTPRQEGSAFKDCADLDEYFAHAQENAVFEQQKSSLLGVLRKTHQQKARALAQVQRGAQESTRADEFQKYGDLLLSQLYAVQSNASEAELTDYFAPDAGQITVALNPDLSPQENAQKYFQKARSARESAEELHALQDRLEDETNEVAEAVAQVEAITGNTEALKRWEEKARAENWLRSIPEGTAREKAAANKPEFGGFKIKRFTSPDGYEVLVGESATANDYLVTRLAHSNDWWLHLRGGTSSHAIIKTQNAPDRVPRSTLLFAARLVIARSVAKHAGWAEVDYTLRKYVRKPRKAAPGSVTMTNQKTLHVEPEKK